MKRNLLFLSLSVILSALCASVVSRYYISRHQGIYVDGGRTVYKNGELKGSEFPDFTFAAEKEDVGTRIDVFLAENMEDFSATSIGYNKNPEPFNNPTEELKLTMRGMHDLPAQSKTISKGAEEDSLF